MKEEGRRTIGLLILLMAACVATVPSPSTAGEVATAPSPSTAGLAESGVDGSEDYFARMAELLADEQVHFAFFTTWCGRWFEPATPTAVEDRRFFLEKAPVLIDKEGS